MESVDQIKNLLKEIRENKALLDGHIASEKLVELSVLHASLTESIAYGQQKYSQYLDELLEANPKYSVARAKIKAETSDLYLQKNYLERLERSVLEEIRNLRRYIKIREGENETAYNL